MNKPIQYLLVGLPYSGKTTLAKELKNNYGFAHINLDEIKFSKGYRGGDNDVPDSVWDEIFVDADDLIVKYLKEGKNIANEYAWVTKAWRDRAVNVAKRAGFVTQIIYIKLPLDTIRKRWEENMRLKQRFHWPENEFNNYIKDFEEPTSDENVVIYDQSSPVGEWIKTNICKK